MAREVWQVGGHAVDRMIERVPGFEGAWRSECRQHLLAMARSGTPWAGAYGADELLLCDHPLKGKRPEYDDERFVVVVTRINQMDGRRPVVVRHVRTVLTVDMATANQQRAGKMRAAW